MPTPAAGRSFGGVQFREDAGRQSLLHFQDTLPWTAPRERVAFRTGTGGPPDNGHSGLTLGHLVTVVSSLQRTNQWNRAEIPEMDLLRGGQLIFYKGAKTIQ